MDFWRFNDSPFFKTIGRFKGWSYGAGQSPKNILIFKITRENHPKCHFTCFNPLSSRLSSKIQIQNLVKMFSEKMMKNNSLLSLYWPMPMFYVFRILENCLEV